MVAYAIRENENSEKHHYCSSRRLDSVRRQERGIMNFEQRRLFKESDVAKFKQAIMMIIIREEKTTEELVGGLVAEHPLRLNGRVPQGSSNNKIFINFWGEKGEDNLLTASPASCMLACADDDVASMPNAPLGV